MANIYSPMKKDSIKIERETEKLIPKKNVTFCTKDIKNDDYSLNTKDIFNENSYFLMSYYFDKMVFSSFNFSFANLHHSKTTNLNGALKKLYWY